MHAPGPQTRWLAAYSVPAALLLVTLHAQRGLSYWQYSDGVYAYTARALLEGGALYDEIAAAQPPPLLYTGAGLLALGDSVAALRAALAVVAFAGGMLAALAAWRLTASTAAAVGAGLATLVTPWALHEHASFTPEAFAGPLLLAAALAASRPRWAWAGGALAAGAAAFKLAYGLPLAALGLAAARRSSYYAAAAAVSALLWSAFLALHGPALVDNVLIAQRQTGGQGLGALTGLVAQGAWNLLPLAGLCALALALRGRAADPALVRTLVALLAGTLAVFVTLTKDGSYLNFLTVVELPATALAAAGVDWALAAARTSVRGAALRVTVLACLALLALQSAALLISPARPVGFLRPGSGPGHGRLLSDPEVRALAVAAARCPAGAPFSGEPYIAFVARRPMPAGQPDQFIVFEAAAHERLRRAVEAAPRRCP